MTTPTPTIDMLLNVINRFASLGNKTAYDPERPRDEYRLLGIAKQLWFDQRREELNNDLDTDDNSDEEAEDEGEEEDSEETPLTEELTRPPLSYCERWRTDGLLVAYIGQEINRPHLITHYLTYKGTSLLGVLSECDVRLGDVVYLQKIIVPLIGEQPTDPVELREWIESVVLILRCNLTVFSDRYEHGDRIIDRCNWNGLVDIEPEISVFEHQGLFYRVGWI